VLDERGRRWDPQCCDFQDGSEWWGSQLSVAVWVISHGKLQCRHLTPTHVPTSTARSIVADRKRNLSKFYTMKTNKGAR
jgi:hypothetical protein